MKIIFIGDIVGKSGRNAVEKKLPIVKELLANRFSIKLLIIESSLRGSVIIKYKVCKS